MRRERVWTFVAAVVLAALALAPLASSQRQGAAGGAETLVARGLYLTHDVAMCVQCHSPRNESGQIERADEFRGAPIPVKSPFRGQPWAEHAPNLRGLEGFSDDLMRRLLMEGLAHTGAPPQSPMPPFRMNREDADAVIAYLRSLR